MADTVGVLVNSAIGGSGGGGEDATGGGGAGGVGLWDFLRATSDIAIC
jgi:hypothetical protein